MIRIQNGEMDDKIFDMWNSIQRYTLVFRDARLKFGCTTEVVSKFWPISLKINF